MQARGNSPEARSALSDLCDAYYQPVFVFIRHHAADPESARDLTQEFFSRLLSRQSLDHLEPGRGRFRSYLLGAVKNFLADMHDREHRLKRGAGVPAQSLDAGTDTSPGIELPSAESRSPDREFDRKWALTVLDRALTRLAEEHAASGKSDHFEALKSWLTGESERNSQAEAAKQLGMSENAVKVAIHRLRQKFRSMIKEEVGQTLGDPAQTKAELQCLFEALR
jgi:RNA polymerase sigma-70 factor (ECF subfamily)